MLTLWTHETAPNALIPLPDTYGLDNWLRQVRSHARRGTHLLFAESRLSWQVRQIGNQVIDDDERLSCRDKADPPQDLEIVTWRSKLQLTINAPVGVLWVADKTNPAVHAFDMSMLAAIHAEWMAPMNRIE